MRTNFPRCPARKLFLMSKQSGRGGRPRLVFFPCRCFYSKEKYQINCAKENFFILYFFGLTWCFPDHTRYYKAPAYLLQNKPALPNLCIFHFHCLGRQTTANTASSRHNNQDIPRYPYPVLPLKYRFSKTPPFQLPVPDENCHPHSH